MQAAGAGGGSGSRFPGKGHFSPPSPTPAVPLILLQQNAREARRFSLQSLGTSCQTFHLHGGGRGRLFVRSLWRNSWKYGSGNSDGCGKCYRWDDSCCVSEVDSLSRYFSPSSLINPELLRFTGLSVHLCQVWGAASCLYWGWSS